MQCTCGMWCEGCRRREGAQEEVQALQQALQAAQAQMNTIQADQRHLVRERQEHQGMLKQVGCPLAMSILRTGLPLLALQADQM